MNFVIGNQGFIRIIAIIIFYISSLLNVSRKLIKRDIRQKIHFVLVSHEINNNVDIHLGHL